MVGWNGGPSQVGRAGAGVGWGLPHCEDTLNTQNTNGPAEAGPLRKNRNVRHSVQFSIRERHARVKLLEEMVVGQFQFPQGRG